MKRFKTMITPDNYTTESLKEIELKKQIAELEAKEEIAELWAISIATTLIVSAIFLMLFS
jgi:hypothetical protein